MLAAEDGGRRAQAAGGSGGYGRALKRFWYVLVLGSLVAAFAAVSALYNVTLFPPALESREVVTYSSSARLLVTSDDASHLRSQITVFGEPARPGEGEEAGEEGDEPSGEETQPAEPPVAFVTAPDFNVLIRAANLFPLLIESDEVSAFRQEEYGTLPGTISAQGIYSFSTANRFELSEIPVIQLVAVSARPGEAVDLADKTAKAFISWVEAQQEADEIPEQDRLVVQQLNSPQAAASVTGASKAMPALVFLVVLGAFCVLAIVLDRLFPPRRKPIRADLEPIERPVKVKKTA